jgi:hypothetical protein
MRGTVIKVGSGGRGFIIETKEARYVVTAAHCLSSGSVVLATDLRRPSERVTAPPLERTA